MALGSLTMDVASVSYSWNGTVMAEGHLCKCSLANFITYSQSLFLALRLLSFLSLSLSSLSNDILLFVSPLCSLSS